MKNRVFRGLLGEQLGISRRKVSFLPIANSEKHENCHGPIIWGLVWRIPLAIGESFEPDQPGSDLGWIVDWSGKQQHAWDTLMQTTLHRAVPMPQKEPNTLCIPGQLSSFVFFSYLTSNFNSMEQCGLPWTLSPFAVGILLSFPNEHRLAWSWMHVSQPLSAGTGLGCLYFFTSFSFHSTFTWGCLISSFCPCSHFYSLFLLLCFPFTALLPISSLTWLTSCSPLPLVTNTAGHNKYIMLIFTPPPLL